MKHSLLINIFLVIIYSQAFCASSRASGYEVLYQNARHSYTDPSVSMSQTSPAAAPDITLSYDRANEVRSLMAGYLSAKISTLQILSSGDDVDGMRKLLGEFCTKAEQADDVETSTCAKRYIQMQRPIIYKLKRGMDESSDAQARLICTRDSSGNCPQSSALAFEVRNSKDPAWQVPRVALPYLPTYVDLQEYAIKNHRPISQDEYRKWVDQSFKESDNDEWFRKNIAIQPAREDFVKTKTVPRDPKHPDLETLTLIEKDPQTGKALIDEVAYKRAIDEWNANREEIKQTLAQDQRKDSELNEAHRQFVQSKPLRDSKDLPDFASNAGVYAQSRGELVDEANRMATRPKLVKPKINPKAKSKSTAQNGLPPIPGSLQNDLNQQAVPVSQLNQPQNTVPTQPSQPDSAVIYRGDEKVNPVSSQNGIKPSGSNSVIYNSDLFSVEEVLRTIDLDP